MTKQSIIRKAIGAALLLGVFCLAGYLNGGFDGMLLGLYRMSAVLLFIGAIIAGVFLLIVRDK